MPQNDEPQKPKRVRKDRREDILEKATQLFAEYGFQGATLAQIAAAVGLTEPGVLHYFPSKVHLLQGVLEARDRKDFARYAHLIDAPKGLDEYLELLNDVVAQDEQIPGLIQLLTVLAGESIRRDHPSHAFFVERYRRGRDLYGQQFVRMDPSETRPDVDAAALAALIMAVRDGLQIQWLLDPENASLARSFALFTEIVAAYLRPGPPPPGDPGSTDSTGAP